MKINTIAASLRTDSLNKKLLTIAEKIAQNDGVTPRRIDLRDFQVPAYDGDIEAKAIPEGAQKLGSVINETRVLIIASPEYNFSMPGHFKNTFDWISRIRPMPWAGKIVCLMSASPSLVGGNRSLWSLRVPFEACGSIVYPEMFSLSVAHEAFDADGNFVDQKNQERLTKNVKAFMKFAQALNNS